MRVVAALGGNALLQRGELADAQTQRRNVARAVGSLAEIAREHELIVTHGNGPQVGLLALEAEAYHAVRPYPLDVLGAETEGMVGYLLEQGLRAELPERDVATLLTQVIVDPDDPALAAEASPSLRRPAVGCTESKPSSTRTWPRRCWRRSLTPMRFYCSPTSRPSSWTTARQRPGA